MKRSFIAVIILVLLGAAVLVQSPPNGVSGQNEQSETYNQTMFLMDTTVDIRAIGHSPEEAVRKAFTEVDRVEQLFSRYEPQSEVSQINANAGEWVPVSAEVFSLLEQGLDFGNLTDGRFDVTIGPLITLWGFGTDSRNVPAREDLDETLAFVNFAAVQLDGLNSSVRIPAGYALDLGGIAKGYAVDAAAEVLRAQGIERGLINAGGDISVIGTRDTDGSPWRVGIQDPSQPDRIMAVVELVDRTVVTSGDYQRYFEVDGVRFHHIIDPTTGFPADELTSVTVVAPSAAAGDAWSTALFVLGMQRSQELVEAEPDIEAIIVDKDGTLWVSSGLEGSFRVLK